MHNFFLMKGQYAHGLPVGVTTQCWMKDDWAINLFGVVGVTYLDVQGEIKVQNTHWNEKLKTGSIGEENWPLIIHGQSTVRHIPDPPVVKVVTGGGPSKRPNEVPQGAAVWVKYVDADNMRIKVASRIGSLGVAPVIMLKQNSKDHLILPDYDDILVMEAEIDGACYPALIFRGEFDGIYTLSLSTLREIDIW